MSDNSSMRNKKESYPNILDNMDRLFLNRFMSKQLPLENTMRSKIKRWMNEQRVEVLRKLKELFEKRANIAVVKDFAEHLFDREKEIKKLKKFMEPVYLQSIIDGANMVREELGLIGIEFEPLPAAFLARMDKRLLFIPKEVTGTIRRNLQKQILEGISKGEGVNDIAKRIRSVYNEGRKRSLTIARTETATMINSGRFEEMKRNTVIRHRWLTATDEFSGDSHRKQSGIIRDIGEAFPNGLKFPNDPDGPIDEVSNCRCLALPIIDDS